MSRIQPDYSLWGKKHEPGPPAVVKMVALFGHANPEAVALEFQTYRIVDGKPIPIDGLVKLSLPLASAGALLSALQDMAVRCPGIFDS